ncbi:MAG: integration host factor subunit beta [Bacteroidales bacterium]|nr:integration host factor subunit beta [Candidatus Colimorpha onthohippi]
MTKAEIVSEIHQKTGIDRTAALIVVEEMMTSIMSAMRRGENVYLRGFGTFEIVRRAEKTGRNITKNTPLVIPAHNIPKFKPCKEFKDQIKESTK